jgi:uncharacterized repeat protein (TIGR03803 family)
VLYVFGTDQADPRAPATPAIEFDGALYGTTSEGGSYCDGNCGTVYRVSLAGRERVVYNFQGGPDGSGPTGLVKVGETLYGTTLFGGINRGRGKRCCGTFYSLTASGEHTVLYRFAGHPDVGFPDTPLVEMGGSLYGSSQRGGSQQEGTVFSVTPSGSERVVHSFSSDGSGDDPNGPLTPLNKTLYGTTDHGGTAGCGRMGEGCGVVFSLTP